MLSNSASLKLFAVILFTCIGFPAYACEICPSQAGQTLKNVDIFDGTPEEMATLVPDKGDEKTGF
ncbi:MAG TPA: STY0301 family protein, partial [Methanosarcina sp.]|nr:STY0301 family protein [Methanosarcina sp.]